MGQVTYYHYYQYLNLVDLLSIFKFSDFSGMYSHKIIINPSDFLRISISEAMDLW